ncbi:magnesium transporter, partial [Bacillus mycoides]|nr:magnesium transporter [Bacillus mycoides]
MKLSGMSPGLSKQHMGDELQCETVTDSRVAGGSVTGLNSELKMMKLPVQELVPGDMIFLSEGDTVPSAVRIVYANELLVKESMLTGSNASI